MTELAEKITREITRRGSIPFSEFMELALYCPVYGYYEAEEDNLGRGGDFFTSVSVGPLFGQMLAFQFADWLAALPGAEKKLHLVEAGAHNGRLARDILGWLREHRPELFQCVEYWIIEPSPLRTRSQQKNLFEFSNAVKWAEAPAALNASSAIHGVIFSNELFDAFPVHRIGWDRDSHSWYEWHVSLKDGEFAWLPHPGPLSEMLVNDLARLQLPEDLLNVLPDDFTTELCPLAGAWWREAAGLLQAGQLMTVDYGLTTEEFFLPERSHGTLRAYYRHHLSHNVLNAPGEQDLTAHVNFSYLRAVGETNGLRTVAFQTQAQFLTEIAAKFWQSKAEPEPVQVRQFQTLTHPEHLGHAFRILVQSPQA
jgi:SAM-dependent MidA family methyltransferase